MTDSRTDEVDDAPDPTRSKVGRLIAEYELTGVGERLEASWTGDGDEEMSLRELAEYFNLQLLRAVLERNDVRPLDGEVENLYGLLTDSDRSPGARAEAKSRLERDGIDVEALQRNFVSHQAVHTYLTKYRGVSHDAGEEDEDPVGTSLDAVQRLRNRTSAVTKSNVSSLANAGHVTVGDFEVRTNVRIFCEDCGQQYEIAEFLERGGCDCRDAGEGV